MVQKALLGRASSKSKSGRTLQSRPARVADKRKAVMDAALELFSRYGLHGTSIDQVAARSGVSKSNLLYYFSSKEELYVSVLRDLLAVWLAPLDELEAAQDPREAIANYIRSKLVLARDRPAASRLFCLEMVQGAPLLRETLEIEVSDLLQRKSALLNAWVAQGQLAAVPVHHLLFTIWATTQHYADFAVQVEATLGKTLNDPEFFEETVQSVQRIVLGGVCAQGPTPASVSPSPPAVDAVLVREASAEMRSLTSSTRPVGTRPEGKRPAVAVKKTSAPPRKAVLRSELVQVEVAEVAEAVAPVKARAKKQAPR